MAAVLLLTTTVVNADNESIEADKPESKTTVIPVQDLSDDVDELPRAENIDLEQPIDELPAAVSETESAVTAEQDPSAAAEADDEQAAEKPTELKDRASSGERDEKAIDETMASPAVSADPAIGADAGPEQGFVLLGKVVPAGTATRLAWTPSQSFEGIAGSTPVLVVNGQEPGPVLCLSAAVHGDELNGIEIVRRVVYDIAPKKLTGTVIGVPIVNIQGFQRNSRYLTDRRDLNRFFPGNPKGSLASRIAASLFTEIISKCSYLVDLHTGSFHRTNLPQIRADLQNPAVAELSRGFGSTVVLHSSGAKGTLRHAANMAGVAAVTLEAGEPMRLQDKEVAHGVKAIETLMSTLGMQKRARVWGKPEPVFYKSTWVRADHGGILFSEVFLGKRIDRGDLLGTVTDPITNKRHQVLSPTKGRVLGMALNQVVMPGFAAFRIGIESRDPSDAGSGAEQEPASEDKRAANGDELSFEPESSVEPEPVTAE